jgi:hypothetical protein
VPAALVPSDLWVPNSPLWVQLDDDLRVVRVRRREEPEAGQGGPVRFLGRLAARSFWKLHCLSVSRPSYPGSSLPRRTCPSSFSMVIGRP